MICMVRIAKFAYDVLWGHPFSWIWHFNCQTNHQLYIGIVVMGVKLVYWPCPVWRCKYTIEWSFVHWAIKYGKKYIGVSNQECNRKWHLFSWISNTCHRYTCHKYMCHGPRIIINFNHVSWGKVLSSGWTWASQILQVFVY